MTKLKSFCVECELIGAHTVDCSQYEPSDFQGYKLTTSRPMPFVIPKGYKSPFVEAEIALNGLWAGQKKFLRQFESKKGVKKYWGIEGTSGGEFNPENVKETASE